MLDSALKQKSFGLNNQRKFNCGVFFNKSFLHFLWKEEEGEKDMKLVTEVSVLIEYQNIVSTEGKIDELITPDIFICNVF